jgi:hypothetical protein
MLTLSQALAISLTQPQPPWSTSNIRGSNRKSLRSFVETVGDQQVLMFVQIRPIALLNGVSTVQELRAKWNNRAADKATLDALAKALHSSGASIVYQSRDRKIVGIKGTNSSFEDLGGIQLDDKKDPNKGINDALGTIGQGGAAAAAGPVALAAASAAGVAGAAEAIIVIGSFFVAGFAGLTLGAGMAALIAAAGAEATSAPKDGGGSSSPGGAVSPPTDDEIIFGLIPDNLTPEILDQLIKMEFGVDIGVPDPGQLPGAGDLAPGGDENGDGGGGIPGIGVG